MRKPAAIEQRQHGGVARVNPGLACRRRRADRDRPCAWPAATGSGRGRVLPIFGARTAASAPTLPLPLRSRKRANARVPASARISERLPMPSARRAARKARTSAGVSARELRERWRAAEVLGEEAEELQHIAPVGLDRLRRHAPLGAEIGEPAVDLGRDLGAMNCDSLSASCPLSPRRGGLMRIRPPARNEPIIAPPRFRFLNRVESAQNSHHAQARRRCPRAGRARPGLIPIGCRRSSRSRPAIIVCVPLGAREATAVVWAENPKPNPRLDNRLKDVDEKTRRAAAQARAAQLRRLGGELHARARAAWCCACACAWASISAPSASASACALPAPPPQRMTAARAPRARASRRRHGARQERGGARSRRQSAGVIDGLIDEGTLETVVLPPEPVAEKPDPGFRQAGFSPAQSAAAAMR